MCSEYSGPYSFHNVCSWWGWAHNVFLFYSLPILTLLTLTMSSHYTLCHAQLAVCASTVQPTEDRKDMCLPPPLIHIAVQSHLRKKHFTLLSLHTIHTHTQGATSPCTCAWKKESYGCLRISTALVEASQLLTEGRASENNPALGIKGRQNTYWS